MGSISLQNQLVRRFWRFTLRFGLRLLVILGAGLFVLNVFGRWLLPTAQGVRPLVTPWDSVNFVSHHDRDALADYVGQIDDGAAFNLQEAVRKVRETTVHTDDRRITVVENWLQYFLGVVYEPLSHTQDADRLIAGRVANCSERAQILQKICEAGGCPSRFCGLDGHVVLEVLVNAEWYTVDPDYGVVFSVPMRSLAHRENSSLVRRTLARNGYSKPIIDRYLQILQSSNDNVVLRKGVPLSPRLFAMERACNWLVWVLPILSLTVGSVGLRTKLVRSLT